MKRWIAKLFTTILITFGLCGGATIKAKQVRNKVKPDLLVAVTWYQNSAEAKALYLQGYNMAQNQLQQTIKHYHGKKKPAVMLDIDETILDNSPYYAYAALHPHHTHQAWLKWVNSSQAQPVYGVQNFLKQADQLGVAIFYVSNRDYPIETKATLANLRKDHLPQVSASHLLLQKKFEKSKKRRRHLLEQRYNIVMLVGDNLLDFKNPTANTLKARNELVQQTSHKWGRKYIILPNPMYGSWKNVLKSPKLTRSLTYFDPKTRKLGHQS